MNHDSRIVEIELEKIVPNRFQPRKTFNDDVTELAESIRTYGVLQPITVRPLGEKFEIIMGERRYRAVEKLGMHKIPCIVVEMNDRESMEVALIENLQRQDLNPIEEALSYKRILDAGYITQDQLATRLGKNQSTIANKLRLLSLDKEVQTALLKGKISERHARSLLRLTNKDLQKELLNRIINEKLTVKRTDEEIRIMETEVNKKEEIEIIDFDDNPFKDPTPVVEEKPKALERVQIEANKPTIPQMGIIDDFEEGNVPTIESNHSFDLNDNKLNEFEPDIININEEKENKSDFDKIKEIIEKCKNDIKNLGYNVDYEKYDFETMYQITFKITK